MPVKRTSELLEDIRRSCQCGGPIMIGDFLELLGDRIFGVAVLIFALPNSLPIQAIPGVSTVTGLPIAFIAAQMMLGKQTCGYQKKLSEKNHFAGISGENSG